MSPQLVIRIPHDPWALLLGALVWWPISWWGRINSLDYPTRRWFQSKLIQIYVPQKSAWSLVFCLPFPHPTGQTQPVTVSRSNDLSRRWWQVVPYSPSTHRNTRSPRPGRLMEIYQRMKDISIYGDFGVGLLGLTTLHNLKLGVHPLKKRESTNKNSGTLPRWGVHLRKSDSKAPTQPWIEALLLGRLGRNNVTLGHFYHMGL